MHHINTHTKAVWIWEKSEETSKVNKELEVRELKSEQVSDCILSRIISLGAPFCEASIMAAGWVY